MKNFSIDEISIPIPSVQAATPKLNKELIVYAAATNFYGIICERNVV